MRLHLHYCVYIIAFTLLCLRYCVYVIEDFVVMSCNILFALFCLRYFAYTQITHLSQNDCLTNVRIYSIPTFWQNEGIAHKKYSPIPTFWQKRTIETSAASATSATLRHSFRSSTIRISHRFQRCELVLHRS